MDRSIFSLKRTALAAVAVLALLVPASAGAATVVNGGFESGNLDGWQIHNSTPSGSWFAYSGTETPLPTEESENSIFPPPQGSFAAVSDEVGPVTAILYQDIGLEAGWSHQLRLTLYYKSYAPIEVPEPNTLSATETGPDNQQLRVDVMRAGTPIDSLNPADVLTTVFANKNGDPQVMLPTELSADLTPFAGQTVRLRIANAVAENFFNAGLDAVSITSTPPPPPPPPPSNAISRGKLTLNKKNGTAKLAINVPGPGTLTAVAKGKAKRLRNASLTASAAGTVKVPLNPNGAGKKVLNDVGKLKARVDITFTPTGGAANTQTYKVSLKKNLPKAPKG